MNGLFSQFSLFSALSGLFAKLGANPLILAQGKSTGLQNMPAEADFAAIMGNLLPSTPAPNQTGKPVMPIFPINPPAMLENLFSSPGMASASVLGSVTVSTVEFTQKGHGIEENSDQDIASADTSDSVTYILLPPTAQASFPQQMGNFPSAEMGEEALPVAFLIGKETTLPIQSHNTVSTVSGSSGHLLRLVMASDLESFPSVLKNDSFLPPPDRVTVPLKDLGSEGVPQPSPFGPAQSFDYLSSPFRVDRYENVSSGLPTVVVRLSTDTIDELATHGAVTLALPSEEYAPPKIIDPVEINRSDAVRLLQVSVPAAALQIFQQLVNESQPADHPGFVIQNEANTLSPSRKDSSSAVGMSFRTTSSPENPKVSMSVVLGEVATFLSDLHGEITLLKPASHSALTPTPTSNTFPYALNKTPDINPVIPDVVFQESVTVTNHNSTIPSSTFPTSILSGSGTPVSFSSTPEMNEPKSPPSEEGLLIPQSIPERSASRTFVHTIMNQESVPPLQPEPSIRVLQILPAKTPVPGSARMGTPMDFIDTGQPSYTLPHPINFIRPVNGETFSIQEGVFVPGGMKPKVMEPVRIDSVPATTPEETQPVPDVLQTSTPRETIPAESAQGRDKYFAALSNPGGNLSSTTGLSEKKVMSSGTFVGINASLMGDADASHQTGLPQIHPQTHLSSGWTHPAAHAPIRVNEGQASGNMKSPPAETTITVPGTILKSPQGVVPTEVPKNSTGINTNHEDLEIEVTKTTGFGKEPVSGIPQKPHLPIDQSQIRVMRPVETLSQSQQPVSATYIQPSSPSNEAARQAVVSDSKAITVQQHTLQSVQTGQREGTKDSSAVQPAESTVVKLTSITQSVATQSRPPQHNFIYTYNFEAEPFPAPGKTSTEWINSPQYHEIAEPLPTLESVAPPSSSPEMKGTIFPQMSVPEDPIPLDLFAKPQEPQFHRASDAAEIQRSTVQFMPGEMKPKGSDAANLYKPFVESVDSILKGNSISWISSVHVPEESPRAGNQVETHGDVKSPAPVMPGPLSTLTNGSIGKIPQSFHEPSVTPEPVMVKAAGVVADRPVEPGVAVSVNPESDPQPQGMLKPTLPEVSVPPEPAMVKAAGVVVDRPVGSGVAVSVNPESDPRSHGTLKSTLLEALVLPESAMVKAAGVVVDRPVESGVAVSVKLESDPQSHGTLKLTLPETPVSPEPAMAKVGGVVIDRPVESGVAVSVNPGSDSQPQGTLKSTLPEALVTPEPAMAKVGGVVADRPVESGVAMSVDPWSDSQPQGTLKPTLPEVFVTPEPVMVKAAGVVADRPVEPGVAVSVNPESDPQPQGTLKSSLPEVLITPEPAMAKVGGVVADRPVESGVAVSVDPGSDSQPQGTLKSSVPEVLITPEPAMAKNQLSTPNDQDLIREFTNGQVQADQGTVKIKGQAHIGNLSTSENSPVKPLDDSVGELPQPLPSMISRHSTVQQAKDILALDQTENAGRSEPVETLGRRLSIDEPIPVKPEIQANPEPIQKSTNSSSQEQADQPARSQSFVGRVQPVPSSESGLMTREMLSQSEVVRTSDKQTIQTQSGRIEVMAFQSIETSPLSAETTEGSAGPWVPARGERENGGSETNRQPNPKLENTLSHESSQKVRKDTALLMSPEALSGPSTPPAKTSGETTELPEPAIQSQTGVRNPTLSTRSSNEVGGEAEGLPEKVSSETLSKSISMPESSQKESASGPKVSTELDRVVPRAAQADPGDSQPPISSIKEVAEVIPLRVVREPQMDRSPRREMESQMTSQRSGSGLVISSTTDTAEGIASPQGSTLRTSTTVDVEANILNQVVHAAQLKKTSVGSEIRVRLVPENLGEVHLKVNMTPEGLVAELTASRMATREVLTKHVQQIQGMLVETGLRVDQVVVKTGGMDSAPDFKGSGSSRDPFPQGQDWTNGSQSRDRGARDPWRGYQNPFEEKQPGGWERYA